MAADPYKPEDEEVTIGDEEWPVAEQYRVEPRPEAPPEEAADPLVVADDGAPGPVRRFPPDLGPGLLLALLGILLLLALIPAGLWLVGRDDASEASRTTDGVATTPTTPTTPATARTVPDLTGLGLQEARELLEQDDLRFRVRRVASDRPVGEVLEQAPAAGADVSPDLLVVLTVARAAAPERVTVPDVEGLSASEAESLLRQAGLDPTVRTVRSPEPEGTVVDQAPGPDEEVPPRTVVVLEVAAPPAPPPAPATIQVPSLVGLTSAEARSRLRELGLRFTQRPVESSRPKGTVTAQSPRAGARLREGQAVTLSVSTGPARVAVPDVVGLDEQSARRELEARGFEVEVVEGATDVLEEDGVVLDQEPAGGSNLPKGSVVTITVGLFG